MDHDLKTYLDSLQAQLSSIEQRMTTKTDLDAVGRRMAADLVSAVERLDESIKGRKEDENALYRVAEDHEQRIKRLEQKAL